MLLFGLLNGLGQCLQYQGATTQWQHRAQQAVGEVEEGEERRGEGGGEGEMVELNEKLNKKHKEKDKNAGFTIERYFTSLGLTECLTRGT